MIIATIQIVACAYIVLFSTLALNKMNSCTCNGARYGHMLLAVAALAVALLAPRDLPSCVLAAAIAGYLALNRRRSNAR